MDGAEGSGIRLSKRFNGGKVSGGSLEVDYKTKSGSAWSHSFLNQKPWHPLSYPNQRRKWIAEQTHAQHDRRAEEVAREFAQEQEFFKQAALISKKEREKIETMKAVSFMYVRPPGYDPESAKAAEHADETRKEGQGTSTQHPMADDNIGSRPAESVAGQERKKPRPKDVFGRALPTEEEFDVLKNAPRLETGLPGRVKPFAVEVRNVKCLRCGNFGHQSGDRDCPLKDAVMPNEELRLKRDDPLTAIIAHTDPGEPLKWELKQKPGLSPPRGGFDPDDPNQQIVAEDIFDEYGGFLGDSIPIELLSRRVFRLRFGAKGNRQLKRRDETMAMAMMHTQPQGYHHPQTLEEVRTLWIGDLQYWVDENYLTSCFAQTSELVSVKVIRNKITGQPEGYGFIEFVSHAAAERTLQTYNGTQMPGTELTFRLNWASFGSGQKVDAGPDHSIFVGDLAPDVTDYLLQETFRVHYSSVRGAKVVTDPSTGRSKGYGFVKFAEEAERNRAMAEMNGLYCSTRPMRISAATPKKSIGLQQQYVAKAAYPVQVPVPSAVAAPVPAYVTQPAQVLPPENDITCTTVSISNLDPNVTEEELKKAFSQLGEIIYVKIPATKGYGFVQFKTRASAEEAVQKMQGHMIGQQAVRISWSKNPGQDGWVTQADPNQWNGYYGYGQGYDAYGYGATQDPSLYAYGGYSYPQYPQQGEGTQEITNSAAGGDQELYDPMATADVDRLNAVYLSVHASAILGRPLWQRTSALTSQLGK